MRLCLWPGRQGQRCGTRVQQRCRQVALSGECLVIVLPSQVIVSQAGRAKQMNAGWKQSRGSNVLFLHADSKLPSGCVN